MASRLVDLASVDGVPLSSIGSRPYVPPPRADINGPIDPEALAAYLARVGQIYPPLFPVNQAAWDAAVQRMPESLNIEDWRGLSRDPTRRTPNGR